MNLVYILSCFYLHFTVIYTQKFTGDNCVLQRTGEHGVCTSLKECQPALLDLKQQKLPQTCSFQGKDPIVCCTAIPSTTVKTTTSVEVHSKGDVGYKSQKKCEEYGKMVLQKPYYIPLIPGPQLIVRNECHIPTALIIQGNKAMPKEFPHMAFIGYDSSNRKDDTCSGSLISENYVLTSAYCVSNSYLGNAKYVRLGDYDISREDDDTEIQELKVIEIIKHPEYKPPSPYNDIGLLKLEKNVVFSPFVKPICLDSNGTLKPERAIATGWGSIEYLTEDTNPLYKLTLNLLGYESCKKKFVGGNWIIKHLNDSMHQCTADVRDYSCQGDTGGPLQIYHKEMYCSYLLIGVTSSKSCGLANRPGIFTRVSNYMGWIEKTVWPN